MDVQGPAPKRSADKVRSKAPGIHTPFIINEGKNKIQAGCSQIPSPGSGVLRWSLFLRFPAHIPFTCTEAHFKEFLGPMYSCISLPDGYLWQPEHVWLANGEVRPWK